MAGANPLWGAPRIHGELLTLGIDESQATVAKYMPRHRRSSSQTWRTFLTNHVNQITAADIIVVPTATCRLLFVLVILAHQSRRVVQVAVTAHPTAAWTAQQLREAFPGDEVPKYSHSRSGSRVRGDRTAERVRGAGHRLDSTRVPRSRDVVNEIGLSRILTQYLAYYHQSRTHLSLAKDTPQPRLVAPPPLGPVVAIPQVGGLHHRYDRRAA